MTHNIIGLSPKAAIACSTTQAYVSSAEVLVELGGVGSVLGILCDSLPVLAVGSRLHADLAS